MGDICMMILTRQLPQGDLFTLTVAIIIIGIMIMVVMMIAVTIAVRTVIITIAVGIMAEIGGVLITMREDTMMDMVVDITGTEETGTTMDMEAAITVGATMM